MSTIVVGVANVRIIVSSSGVYILLVLIASFFVVKAIFDVIDFKVNQSYYINNLRNRRKTNFKQNKSAQKLVQCQKCKYACRIEWRKCPICETKIILKIK